MQHNFLPWYIAGGVVHNIILRYPLLSETNILLQTYIMYDTRQNAPPKGYAFTTHHSLLTILYSYRNASAIGTDDALRAGTQVIRAAATNEAPMKKRTVPHGITKPLNSAPSWKSSELTRL